MYSVALVHTARPVPACILRLARGSSCVGAAFLPYSRAHAHAYLFPALRYDPVACLPFVGLCLFERFQTSVDGRQHVFQPGGLCAQRSHVIDLHLGLGNRLRHRRLPTPRSTKTVPTATTSTASCAAWWSEVVIPGPVESSAIPRTSTCHRSLPHRTCSISCWHLLYLPFLYFWALPYAYPPSGHLRYPVQCPSTLAARAHSS